MFLSSASDVSSEMYKQYKLAFQKMLLGDPNYFVCDMDYHFSIAPFMDGKPMRPLITQEKVDQAYKTNPYAADREFGNIWSDQSGPDCLVRRFTLDKYSQPMYPIFENEDGKKKYIIAYDPANKVDNSIVGVGELFRDEKKGLMLKVVNMKSMLEVLPSGDKVVKQQPEQIQILKKMIMAYNKGALDYDNLDMLIIDSGAGGGGFQIAQYLMSSWTDEQGKQHIGFIDKNDDYMKLRMDDPEYIGNSEKLRLFSFKKNKTEGYERCQAAINQGLVIFPKDLNIRQEIEFEEIDPETESVSIRYEKPDLEEIDPLVQISLAKEELASMIKVKKPNGTVQIDLTPQAKARNTHDELLSPSGKNTIPLDMIYLLGKIGGFVQEIPR